MADFNKKGKYLTAEVRFRYNEREGVIELTSKDPDLRSQGFMHRIYPDSHAGKVLLSEIEKHTPELKNIFSPIEFPNGPLLLPSKVGEPSKIPLGTGQKNEEICWDVEQNTHSLITGRAGSGKSIARTVILRHLQNHPDDWAVYGIDLAGNAREDHLSREMHHSIVADSYVAAMTTVRSIREKIDKREPLGKRVMILIDDFGLLMSEYHSDENLKMPQHKRQHNYDLLEDLTYLSRIGSSAGVHLCVITQRVSNEDLPSMLRSNLQLRYAIGQHSNIGSMMTLETVSAARLAELKSGEGVVSTMDGNEVYIQGYYPIPKLRN